MSEETGYQKCVIQEIEYTAGWRDYKNGKQLPPYVTTVYRMGWADHQRRDQRPAMYARKEMT